MIVNQPAMEFVPKGWGFEKWIVNNNKYCGKLLYFVKGRKCSLHFHHIKDETFYIHSGKIRLYYSDDLPLLKGKIDDLSTLYAENSGVMLHTLVGNGLNEITLKQGDNFYIPPGRVHQMVALEDTELFEFSTTHDDEDSDRILKGD